MDYPEIKYNPEKANNTKYSQTKLPWFSRFLRHSTRKGSGLVLQRFQAHMWRHIIKPTTSNWSIQAILPALELTASTHLARMSLLCIKSFIILLIWNIVLSTGTISEKHNVTLFHSNIVFVTILSAINNRAWTEVCSYCPYLSAWYRRETCTSNGFMSVSRSHCCKEFGFSRMWSKAVKHTQTRTTQSLTATAGCLQI